MNIFDKINSLSSIINKIHLKRRRLLSFDKDSSSKIVDILYYAASISPDFLELLKNKIDHENNDFTDLTDLIEDLEASQSARAIELFIKSGPLSSAYLQIKVLSDLDNTAIENSMMAPLSSPTAKNKDLISGFIPFVNALTNGGKTSVTFVSARPKEIEFQSILSIRKKFVEGGLTNFTFASGELIGSIHYASAATIKSKTELYKACLRFASLKMKNYKKLLQVYPASRFVFLGDDTQGDYIFASMFINDRPGNFAFIRKAAKEGNGIHPHPGGMWNENDRVGIASHPRICYHSSYKYALTHATQKFKELLSGNLYAERVAFSESHSFERRAKATSTSFSLL